MQDASMLTPSPYLARWPLQRHSPAAPVAGTGGWSEIARPGALAGVSDDGQVREPLDEWNCADVHRVARHFLEGAYAAFAQNNVGVTLREDVFCGQQPFLDSGRHATFQHHR